MTTIALATTANDLLDRAQAILDGDLKLPANRASRSAALLARRALEEAVADRLGALAPGLVSASTRSRLLVLRLLVDENAGRRAQAAWAGLSRACHRHAFELNPSVMEVQQLIDIVRQVANAPNVGFEAVGELR